jgi:hypothetical protein
MPPSGSAAAGTSQALTHSQKFKMQEDHWQNRIQFIQIIIDPYSFEMFVFKAKGSIKQGQCLCLNSICCFPCCSRTQSREPCFECGFAFSSSAALCRGSLRPNLCLRGSLQSFVVRSSSDFEIGIFLLTATVHRSTSATSRRQCRSLRIQRHAAAAAAVVNAAATAARRAALRRSPPPQRLLHGPAPLPPAAAPRRRNPAAQPA